MSEIDSATVSIDGDAVSASIEVKGLSLPELVAALRQVANALEDAGD